MKRGELKRGTKELKRTGFKKKKAKKKKRGPASAFKPKKLTRKQMVDRLDDIVPKYIKTKYADENGQTRCVTCGKLLALWWFDETGKKRWGKECDSGHFVKRGVMPIRWDERNQHPQCKRCNKHLGGNESHYTLYLIDLYGRETVDELKAIEAEWKARVKKTFPIGDLRELLTEWENRYKELTNGT
jgi:hypothetical protein